MTEVTRDERLSHFDCHARFPASFVFTTRMVLLLFILALSAQPLIAQRWHAVNGKLPVPAPMLPLQDMAHMDWVRRDGAPSDVAALSQTRDGYLWVGSRSGLYRFDGMQFQSYPFSSADPRLPSSDISALAAAPDGGLWIGYTMGGISFLHNGKKIDYDGHNGLISQSTSELHCYPDGSVWAIADGRLMHFTGTAWEIYSANHGLASDGLYTMFFDRDGNLWTADKGHIYELKKGNEKFEISSFQAATANQFVQLQNGEVWISDAWKAVRPIGDSAATRGARIPGVPVLLVDHTGAIWVANDFGGIARITHPGQPDQRVENYTATDGLSDGQTRALYEDRQGSIWVATARGLDRFRPSAVTPFNGASFVYYPALLADPSGGVWMHDMDKPLMRWQNGRFSFVGQPHGSSVLYQDPAGGVWLMDQITRDFYRYPAGGGAPLTIHVPKEGMGGETWCIGQDHDGNLLAGFEGHGLWRYAQQTWQQVKAPGMPDEAPLALRTTSDGSLWIGYPHNEILRNQAGHYQAFSQPQGLEVNSVFVLYEADHILFAGGSDGVAWYDGSRFHMLRLRTPGLLRGVSGIALDHFGDLWLNASTGLLHLPSAEWNHAMRDPAYGMDFQLLNEAEGLQGPPTQNKPSPSAVTDKSGRLWLATSGHVYSLDPAQVRGQQFSPEVLVQSLLVNGETRQYTPGKPITIEPRALKRLEFDFIAVDLAAPQRVVYQYMLEGQDKVWQDAGARHLAIYTNLPAGTYHFRVRAASGTGPWRELTTAPIEVKPRFYQTVWFYLFAGLSLLLLLFAGHRLRMKRITARIRERLEQRAQERLRIARELHDTLLQGIQGLVLQFHVATLRLPQAEPVRGSLLDALDSADLIIREGREKVRELRSEPGEESALEERLQKVAESLTMQSGIPIRILVNGQPRVLSPRTQEEFYWVGREAMTNAVRHARPTQIVLSLTYDLRNFAITCEDNGSGIDPAIRRAGFRQGHWGIPGMHERAQALGSRLQFTDAAEGGTIVRIVQTARRAYERDEEASLSEPRWWHLTRLLRGRSTKSPRASSSTRRKTGTEPQQTEENRRASATGD